MTHLKLESSLNFAEKCMIFCVYPRAQAREGPDGLKFLLRPRALSFQPNGSASYFERVYDETVTKHYETDTKQHYKATKQRKMVTKQVAPVCGYIIFITPNGGSRVS